MNMVANPITGVTVAHCLVQKRIKKADVGKMTMNDMLQADANGVTVGSLIFDKSNTSLDIRRDWDTKVAGKFILKRICEIAPHIASSLMVEEPTHAKQKAINSIKSDFPDIYKKMSIELALGESAMTTESNAISM
jgi:hypothetical protein